MYGLASYLGMGRVAAVVCAVSVVFSTTIAQPMYVDDWFIHVITWSLLPWSALLLLRLLDARDARSAATFALGLGLALGFQLATGLIVRAASQALILAPLALGRPHAMRRRLGGLAAASVIGIVCGAPNPALLLEEMLYAGSDVADRVEHDSLPLSAHLWGAFLRPFPTLLGLSPGDQGSWQVVGFGPVLAVLALFEIFKGRGTGTVRPLSSGLVFSFAWMILPPSASYNLFSATWTFRDGINFYGILLGGLFLSRVPPRPRLALAGLQWMLLLAAVGPLLKQPMMRALEPSRQGVATARDVEPPGALVRALQAASAGQHARFLFAPRFMAERGAFDVDGIMHNSLAYYGVPIVNVLTRGIATSPLHPDIGLLEGEIRLGQRALFDSTLLNVLGITHVLAMPDDVYGEGLAPEMRLRGRRGVSMLVLRNRDAWPPAVFVDEEAAGIRLPRLSGCEHDRFLCADFGPVLNHRLAGPPIAFERLHDSMTIVVPRSATDRTVMLSTWFRRGWRACPAEAAVFPVFEQLIGVRIPAGVSEVRLAYRPWLRVWIHVSSGIVLLVGGLLFVLLLRRR
jgi:hypothetical protein